MSCIFFEKTTFSIQNFHFKVFSAKLIGKIARFKTESPIEKSTVRDFGLAFWT